ncbi:hypothetical protein FB480_103281 [Agrobacterium vitis]|nr:hypothetical protein FB480_103281 [Agrobacterium vitis]
MSPLPIRSMFIVAALMSGAAHASEITPEQAKEIETNLTSILPKGMIPAGAITVQAKGDAYQVTVDPMELFSLDKKKDIKISGLTPWVYRLRPTDDGLWQLDQQSNLDVKAQFQSPQGPTDVEYAIASSQYNGIFDPALRYAKSATLKAQNLRVTSKNPAQSFDIGLGSLDYSLSSEKGDNNTLNVKNTMTIKDYSQTMNPANKPGTLFQAASGGGEGNITGLSMQAIQEIVLILLQNVPNKHIRLDDKERLKTLFRSSFPLFQNASQNIVYHDVQVNTNGATFGVKNYGLNLNANGIRNDARYAIGLDLAGLKLPPGMLPPTFTSLIPDDLHINVAASGINTQNGVVYMMDNVDFTPGRQMTPPETAEIRRQFFPENTLTLTFDGSHAASSLYDVTVTGKTIIAMSGPDKPQADVTIRAKGLDKTIEYLSSHAKQEPKLGQAAFFMMMAKGFAKTDSNGDNLWHVESDSAGQIKINGHEFQLPSAPKQPIAPPAPQQ